MTLDLISMLTKGQRLVEVPLSDGTLIKVPQWKANGAPSLNAWARQQVSGAAPRAQQGTGTIKQPAATNGVTGAANSPQDLNAGKQFMQSQGKPVVGLYGDVVVQAARAVGYDNVDVTNYHVRKWRSI
jgi:hypothetical protein